ncbi:hypothetical protein, partial [Nocardia sp. NPDC005745]|uniref:hypothetical protein n=1 Tax=Nocardia sp. NPDC005745 TaxID=3157061 RepID=UPI0033CF4490
LVDMGDAAVRIETGWCVRAIADYEIQFEDKPSQAAAAVEAIILGGADEYVITDDDDRWVVYSGQGFPDVATPAHHLGTKGGSSAPAVAVGVTVPPGARPSRPGCVGAACPAVESAGHGGGRIQATDLRAHRHLVASEAVGWNVGDGFG